MTNEGKVLSAQDRTSDFGSAGSRRLLRAGRIPAVIYGKSNAQPIHISLDSKEFTLKMRHFTDTSLLTINVGDKVYECLMKDYQDDLLHDQIKHVDFFQVTRGQKLKTMIDIKIVGDPVGARDGGVLDQVMYQVEIEALPKDLPDRLVLDVSDMELNSTRHLSDLKLPEGVEILDDMTKTVASCRSVKEEPVATPAAADATATDAAASATTPATATDAAPADDAKAKQ